MFGLYSAGLILYFYRKMILLLLLPMSHIFLWKSFLSNYVWTGILQYVCGSFCCWNVSCILSPPFMSSANSATL